MNLDKAYESWGQMSDNRELYFKTKTLFRKMWWLIPTNKPCSYYTLEVLGRALVQANGAQSDKVKAASVMCHVLNFAHTTQPDDNPKPAFGFQDIVDYTGDKPSPMVQAIEERDGGKAAEKAAKAVVQLDAETLKPVKVWKSCNAAQAELGIKNVQRAISRCGIAGGYYWCRPGDEESFKPMDKRANNRVPKPLTPEQKQLHKKVFDAPTRKVPETLQEAHDNLQQAINEHVDEVLRGCTQDELIAELRRRQWKGVLHITQTIEL